MLARSRLLITLVGFGLGLGLGCAHEKGTYENSQRQLVYDVAKSTGSCGRSCCEYGGEEKGLTGTWNSREQTCSWHERGEWNLGCVNWCKRETGLEQ